MNVDAPRWLTVQMFFGLSLSARNPPMAYREFLDSEGVSWTVWDTYPTRPTTMEPDWRDGWLTFQSGATRRRLAPIPQGWAEALPSRLELLCKAAEPVRRETPPYGTESAPSE